ncbi:MAG: pyridoxal-phosphate dependent enzyme [Bacteroidales bacterium]|nr:pyridoxal-phosphate dependent enzyme [Bacteroidales bacterium]
MSRSIPTFEDVEQAHRRISDKVHRTPVLTSASINESSGAELYFKCENFQKTGSFKFRGAANALLQLSGEELSKGVGTHSSGNHAAALALAAKLLDTEAYIVMPNNASPVKKQAVEHYQARITWCEPGLDNREEAFRRIGQATGAHFIHPSGDFNVICGQGTAAKELLEDVPDLDALIAPVGGGGLTSGTAIAARGMKKDIRIYAAEPRMADDAYRSFKQGFLIPVDRPNTIADGLLTSLSPLTFRIISTYHDDIFTTTEENIVQAMRLIWERMKILAEPSAAVALAAILSNRFVFKSKKVGVILSGGNVDLEKLPFAPSS